MFLDYVVRATAAVSEDANSELNSRPEIVAGILEVDASNHGADRGLVAWKFFFFPVVAEQIAQAHGGSTHAVETT